eukprot:GILK01004944.1.p1 GENE.GILK01004944.1~~GILK01004944.1.p1  ORF type:complete len:988 (-),score=205.68 GILK01004944.1:247-3210(-)
MKTMARLALLLCLASCVCLAVVSSHWVPNVIYLRMGHLDTQKMKPFDFSSSIMAKRVGHEDVEQFFVHLKGPITKAKRESVSEALGVPLGPYIPMNTFLVVAPRQVIEKIKGHQDVAWVGPVLAEYKLSPSLFSDSSVTMKTRKVEFDQIFSGQKLFSPEASVAIAEMFKDTDLDSMDLKLPENVVEKTLRKALHVTLATELEMNTLDALAQQWQDELSQTLSEVRITAVSEHKFVVHCLAKDMPTVLDYLTAHPMVHFVDKAPAFTTQNAHARQIVSTNLKAETLPNRYKLETVYDRVGLDGRGEIIGVGDTGLDYTHCFFHDKNAHVAIADSDLKVPNSAHRKIAGYWRFIDDTDFESGHGSHCSGTIAGSHELFDVKENIIAGHRGMAPAARLAVTDVSCGHTTCNCSIHDHKGCPCPPGGCPFSEMETYLPTDLNKFYFPWSYKMGARVHSNSWGDDPDPNVPQADYDSNAADVDRFMYEHPDFLAVFAAGNSGREGFFSVGSPGTAKNCLTVGASRTSHEGFETAVDFVNYDAMATFVGNQMQNQYCTCSKGCDANNKVCAVAKSLKDEETCCALADRAPHVFGALGAACCKKYKALGINKDPENNGLTSIAGFSSRGPTSDGRIKPDISAPGDITVSTNSHGHKAEWECGVNPEIDANSTLNLISYSGTSMATPLTAGAVALVRQYFLEGFYPTGQRNEKHQLYPSAALLKATVINGAIPLHGKNTEHGAHKIDLMPDLHHYSSLPSYQQGHGRLALNNTIPLKGESEFRLFVSDVSKGLQTGEEDFYCFDVIEDDRLLSITLVWTDPPAQPSSLVTLINNLDLEVSIPLAGQRGKTLGNGKLTSNPQGEVEALRDVTNNVERVWLPGALSGTYVVRVAGSHVPVGDGQKYALVISGAFEELPHACSKSEIRLLSEPYTRAVSEKKSSLPLLVMISTVVGAVGMMLGVVFTTLWQKHQRQRTVFAPAGASVSFVQLATREE